MSSPATNLVLIKDMRPLQRGINCEAIVIQKDPDPTVTRDGDNLHKMLIADKTGSISLTIWNNNGQVLRSGDIIQILGGECKFRKGQLQLSVSRNSKIKRIGQDTFMFVEKPNFSEQTQVPQPTINPHMNPQDQQQRVPRHQQARPSPQPQHRGGFRGGRSRDPRQRGRSTPQPQ
ncbi:hypothetical protein BJV82DRAFT_352473 [Fennellomyces sp. T-0311]|nr:hypothetical protein BJV82DRAFT_352473 [Fennellomyces sp. T-0311]